MQPPLVLIISGPPCSGKTTLGKRLAAELRLPFFNKDSFKELLFERLGVGERAWSRQLSLASYDLLFSVVEAQLQAGRSVIVESNFNAEADTPRFAALLAKYPFRPFQVVCRARGETLLQRFQARAASSERHPGHLDHLLADELRQALLLGAAPPLDLPGQRVEIDTTDFDAIDYPDLLSALKSMLETAA
jgi:predicted kinase